MKDEETLMIIYHATRNAQEILQSGYLRAKELPVFSYPLIYFSVVDDFTWANCSLLGSYNPGDSALDILQLEIPDETVMWLDVEAKYCGEWRFVISQFLPFINGCIIRTVDYMAEAQKD